MLFLIFIIVLVLVYLFGVKCLLPLISDFPMNIISNFFNKNKKEIQFYKVDYLSTPFEKAKFYPFYTKLFFWKPNLFDPYLVFFYKVEIEDEIYWLILKKSGSFFHSDKYELYNNSLELIMNP